MIIGIANIIGCKNTNGSGQAPVNLTPPSLSGTPTVGQVLTCSDGTWSGTLPITFTYQWQRNGADITGETLSTYTLVQADAGNDISCVVYATNIVSTIGVSSDILYIYDVNAQAFITAAIITDNTQKLAINQLVIDLKGYGLWSKCYAIYPFVGGTATTHKYNLKDPQDLNAAFRLVFSGGWTHSNTGATGSVNGYATTYVNPSLNLIQDSTHASYYSRTNPTTISGCDLGVRGAAGLGGITIISRYTGNLSYYKVNSANGTDLTFANTNSEGFFMSNRTASNVVNGWKNNTKVVTGTTASNGLANANIVLNAFNDNGSIQLYSPRELAFSSIGEGLNDTESDNLYLSIQTFQTTLSRQV